MPPRRPRDFRLALELLEDEERAFVFHVLARLDMEPEELGAVPPLQQLVDMLASMALVGQMPGRNREKKYRQAAARLGCGDQLRTWYRWQDEAARQLVSPDEDE